MDVRRAAATMAGAAMLSRWRLREQMLDGATRGGGRATRSVVVATEDDDDGWDLPPPPARPRWMRRCRCPLRPTTETTKTRARDDATRRDERGGGATTRDKRQATTARQGATLRSSRHCGDARGLVIYYEFEWEVGRSQIRIRSDSEQVFGRAEKNTRVILRSQTPLSYPSQKKTVQNDVTLIHSENPSEKKRCEFRFKITLLMMSIVLFSGKPLTVTCAGLSLSLVLISCVFSCA